MKNSTKNSTKIQNIFWVRQEITRLSSTSMMDGLNVKILILFVMRTFSILEPWDKLTTLTCSYMTSLQLAISITRRNFTEKTSTINNFHKSKNFIKKYLLNIQKLSWENASQFHFTSIQHKFLPISKHTFSTILKEPLQSSTPPQL